jgi:di/tricarboxylate transporter
MSDAAITMTILAVVVVLFMWNRLPVEIVAVGSGLMLVATGVLTLPQFTSAFGDPAVILIAALFVVSEGLEFTGVTAWAGQELAKRGAGSTTRVLLLVMLLSSVLTAFIGLNGAVAALVPLGVVLAIRMGLPTGRMMMPIAFAGSAGGLLLLIGSPVNILVSDAAESAGLGAFGLAEFGIVGLPLVLCTLAVVLLLGPRLLPQRSGEGLPPDLSQHARTLVEQYRLDEVFHLRVRRGSTLVGDARSSILGAQREGVRVITVLDELAGRPSSDGTVAANDRITVLGGVAEVERYAQAVGAEVDDVLGGATEVSLALMNRNEGVIEALIPPRSRFIGVEISPGSVIAGGLVVLAVQREGSDEAGQISLETGDVLLLEGPWAVLDAAEQDNELLVVNTPDLLRRQAVPRGKGSTRALVILAAMVVMLATGVVPPVVAALLAAGAMIVWNVLPPNQAYRAISWSTVLLVAGMFPMSTAITQSGAAALIAERLVDTLGESGPTALLAGLAVLTLVFSQLISNAATALIMIPIGLSAAEQLGVSGRPILMGICVAAAAAFLTPIATPANLMVMGPGGYRFSDYWKLGLPLAIIFVAAAVFFVPLVWRF